MELKLHCYKLKPRPNCDIDSLRIKCHTRDYLFSLVIHCMSIIGATTESIIWTTTELTLLLFFFVKVSLERLLDLKEVVIKNMVNNGFVYMQMFFSCVMVTIEQGWDRCVVNDHCEASRIFTTPVNNVCQSLYFDFNQNTKKSRLKK